jgi:penicillin-binding protein 1A
VRALAAALFTVLVAGLAALILYTPSTNDLDQRVAAIASQSGEPVLDPAGVPDVMRHAMVAIEDERFYEHHGVDTIGLLRAGWNDVTGMCACEGGSTLSQQLGDVVYYEASNHFARKLPSIVLALRIETHHGKEQILDDYLTVVPTGRGLVGARQAACVYFGTDLTRVTLAQAAEIAGMPQAPSGYDPRYEPNLARHRRDVVLNKMAELGYVSDAQARAAMAEPVLAAGGGCS